MMKKPILALISATLAAATLISPIAAQAQTSRGELRRDRQEIREETRDLRQAQRNGSRADVRDARGEVREAQQEYREDKHDDRRDRRYQNNRGTRFSAPFRYNSFNIGVRLSPQYYGSNYRVSNYSSYRLPAPGYNKRYVRHYRDLLLVNVRSGNVVKVYRGFYR